MSGTRAAEIMGEHFFILIMAHCTTWSHDLAIKWLGIENEMDRDRHTQWGTDEVNICMTVFESRNGGHWCQMSYNYLSNGF